MIVDLCSMVQLFFTSSFIVPLMVTVVKSSPQITSSAWFFGAWTSQVLSASMVIQYIAFVLYVMSILHVFAKSVSCESNFTSHSATLDVGV